MKHEISLTYRSNSKMRMFIEKLFQLINQGMNPKIVNVDVTNDYIIFVVEINDKNL